jgi:hypothetical protein
MLSTKKEVTELIEQGKTLILAGEEEVLRSLPRGKWIGGTIPYFMTAEGGRTSRELIFVEELPEQSKESRTVVYDLGTIPRIGLDCPDNGYTVLIVPAFSVLHEQYALHAPSYDQLFMKVIAGWVAGVHLDDLGKRSPKVFDGATGEVSDSKGVALHVNLPGEYRAQVSVVNIFEQGTGPEIRFPSSGFEATQCIVDGKTVDFAAHFAEQGYDMKSPLVADCLGTLVNVSIQALAGGKVRFYAPVFENVAYRVAKPLANYAQRFAEAIPQGALKTAFSCNCVLNYLYGELEGRKTGPIDGPMTFGEIAWQLVNQTMVYVTIEAA